MHQTQPAPERRGAFAQKSNEETFEAKETEIEGDQKPIERPEMIQPLPFGPGASVTFDEDKRKKKGEIEGGAQRLGGVAVRPNAVLIGHIDGKPRVGGLAAATAVGETAPAGQGLSQEKRRNRPIQRPQKIHFVTATGQKSPQRHPTDSPDHTQPFMVRHIAMPDPPGIDEKLSQLNGRKAPQERGDDATHQMIGRNAITGDAPKDQPDPQNSGQRRYDLIRAEGERANV